MAEPPDYLDVNRLEKLLAVGRSLVTEREPDAVLHRVLEIARELTGARYAALGVLDERKRELARFLTDGIDDEERRRIGPLPRGRGILGELIRDPKPLRLADIGEHPHSYGFPSGHPKMKTFLGAPLVIRGEPFGNLYLADKDDGAEFDESDERLMVVLADWAAVAVDNARAHSRELRRRSELERVLQGLEATTALDRQTLGETDLDRILELIVKRARALVEARVAVVIFSDEEGLEIVAAAGEIEAEIVGTRLAADASDVLELLGAERSQPVSTRAIERFGGFGVDAESGALVPLRARGSEAGILAVFDPRGETEELERDDLLMLESFAISAAAAIIGARRLEDERIRLSIASSEDERKRWARELHDETLQELGALNVMQVSALEVAEPAAIRDALAGAAGQVERIIDNLNSLIQDLRPAALDQLGAGPAIEALVDRVQSRSDLEIELDLDLADAGSPGGDRLEPELEATLYRIVQEALTNVVKHADASRVRVSVEARAETVTAVIEDDGTGLPSKAGKASGFGLVGMEERVAMCGGTLEIGPGARGGVRVTARLPAVPFED